MDHSSDNCEIVKAEDDVSSIQHSQVYFQGRRSHKEWQPSLSKMDSNKYLKDDINKLFEAVDISTSKSLDLADRSRKNASKRPMRVGPSSSPGIGFSEPVSLKQALRGLCISQAGEMAAMRRLPRSPASPGYLDARRSTPVYRSVETAESPRMGREDLIEISLSSGLPPNSLGRKQGYPNMQLPYQTSRSLSHFAATKSTESSCAPSFVSSVLCKPHIQPVETKKVEEKILEPIIKSGQDVLSPPSLSVEPTSNGQFSTQKSDGNSPASEKIEIHPLEPVSVKEEGTTLSSTSPFHNAVDNTLRLHESMSSSSKVASSSSRKVGASMKVAKEAAPRMRRKKKLHIVSSSVAMRSGRPTLKKTTSHEVKPSTRYKNLVVKTLKQERIMIGSDSYASSGVVCSSDFSSGPLICHKCQCSLTNAKKEANDDAITPNHHSKSTSIVDEDNKYSDRSPPDSVLKTSNTSAVPSLQANRTPKLREKAEFSPSSMSSIGEYSASSSISDESNASGSSCGNRPHMSKDFRWEALDNARRQHGFLSLRHFNLLKKLGSGDIGTVYLAELVGANCLFAIKVMDNDFLARRKKMPRAQTEREILRMLDHPFLPTLYAQFTSDDLSCLVMEFCPGGDLHVLRQKQPGRYFPEQAARFYVAEILLALEYLHLLGIVYRDLKPENILVREDGHIMLTDFDLSLRCSVSPTLVKSSSSVIEPPRISGPCAGSNCIDPFCAGPSCKVSCFNPRVLPAAARARRRLAEQTAQSASLPQLVAEPTEARSNSFVGTHEYLAPEIIKGEGHGSAVDWWTLGILLYELLYGKTPFKGPGNDETLTNVVVQSLKFPDSPIVSFQARDLIRGLLVKEPDNRLGTETGAAEIKRHSFFDGMNWALIRCAIPPQIPESLDIGIQRSVLQQKGNRDVEGEQLEFELF